MPHAVLDEIKDRKQRLTRRVTEAQQAADVQMNKAGYWINRVADARRALDEALGGQAAHATKLSEAHAVHAVAVKELDEYTKHVDVLVGPIRDLLA